MEKITEIIKLSLERQAILNKSLYCAVGNPSEENLSSISAQMQSLANELNILAITDYRNFSQPSISILFRELDDLLNIIEDYEVTIDGDWEHYNKKIELEVGTIELTSTRRVEEHKKTQAI